MDDVNSIINHYLIDQYTLEIKQRGSHTKSDGAIGHIRINDKEYDVFPGRDIPQPLPDELKNTILGALGAAQLIEAKNFSVVVEVNPSGNVVIKEVAARILHPTEAAPALSEEAKKSAKIKTLVGDEVYYALQFGRSKANQDSHLIVSEAARLGLDKISWFSALFSHKKRVIRNHIRFHHAAAIFKDEQTLFARKYLDVYHACLHHDLPPAEQQRQLEQLKRKLVGELIKVQRDHPKSFLRDAHQLFFTKMLHQIDETMPRSLWYILESEVRRGHPDDVIQYVLKNYSTKTASAEARLNSLDRLRKNPLYAEAINKHKEEFEKVYQSVMHEAGRTPGSLLMLAWDDPIRALEKLKSQKYRSDKNQLIHEKAMEIACMRVLQLDKPESERNPIAMVNDLQRVEDKYLTEWMAWKGHSSPVVKKYIADAVRKVVNPQPAYTIPDKEPPYKIDSKVSDIKLVESVESKILKSKIQEGLDISSLPSGPRGKGVVQELIGDVNDVVSKSTRPITFQNPNGSEVLTLDVPEKVELDFFRSNITIQLKNGKSWPLQNFMDSVPKELRFKQQYEGMDFLVKTIGSTRGATNFLKVMHQGIFADVTEAIAGDYEVKRGGSKRQETLITKQCREDEALFSFFVTPEDDQTISLTVRYTFTMVPTDNPFIGYRYISGERKITFKKEMLNQEWLEDWKATGFSNRKIDCELLEYRSPPCKSWEESFENVVQQKMDQKIPSLWK